MIGGVGIMIEGCESDSNQGSDDYVELPAITKVDNSTTVSTYPNCQNTLPEIPCNNYLWVLLKPKPLIVTTYRDILLASYSNNFKIKSFELSK